jgi:hypothetical protein
MGIRGTSPRYATAGALAAIALVATACGGGGNGGGATVVASFKPNASNMCHLIPSSEVAAISKSAVTQTTPAQQTDVDGPATYTCEYDLANGSDVLVEVEDSGSSEFFYANGNSVDGGTSLINVPGVGKRAVASVNGIAVLTADYNIEIAIVPLSEQAPYAGAKSLALTAVKALG